MSGSIEPDVVGVGALTAEVAEVAEVAEARADAAGDTVAFDFIVVAVDDAVDDAVVVAVVLAGAVASNVGIAPAVTVALGSSDALGAPVCDGVDVSPVDASLTANATTPKSKKSASAA